MANPLILNTADLREYLAINASFDFSSIDPYLRAAQADLVHEVVGETQLEKFATYASSGTGLSTIGRQGYDLVRKAIANLGLLRYMAIGNVHVSESGISVENNEQRAPASQWRIKDLRRSLTMDGHNALEDVLELMWANAAQFPEWNADVATRIAFRRNFVNTSRQFGQVFPLGDRKNYALFLKLRPTISLVEESYIQAAIGRDFFGELHTASIFDSATTPQTNAIQLLAPAIIHLTVSEGLHTIQAELRETGFMVNRIGASGNNTQLQAPATPAHAGITAASAHHNGNMLLQKAVDFLNENAALYPTFLASDKYEDPSIEQPGINDLEEGEENRGFYAFY